MHRCEEVQPKYVRLTVTINPWGFKGPQPLDTPFSPIFRRATKDGATGGRRFRREVGKKRATKDGVPEGRKTSTAVSKLLHFQVAHVSGQYPTVAKFPFRTIGNLINV